MKPPPRLFPLLALLATAPLQADMISDLTARAEKGEVAAQLELAALYSKGEGVTKDEATAAKWVQKAAEQGDGAAEFALGQKYLKGQGVKKDTEEATKWFVKSAERGNAEAQLALGGLYIGGKGVRKNSTEAAKWYSLAAKGGNPAAQCQLARMHMAGSGVTKDDVEAYKWASAAVSKGDNPAKLVVSFLEGHMTPDKIAEGKQRSADFLSGKAEDKSLDIPDAVPPDEPIPEVTVPPTAPEPQ